MSAPGALDGLSGDDLRAAVRAVLRDVLPRDLVAGGSPVPPAASSAGSAPGGAVVVRDDAELDAFVRRVAEVCADPAKRAALAAGRHGYRLGGADPAPSSPTLRVERGAVTERTVQRASADGARLVLGRRAVLTPLARDRARSLGVAVEKES